MNFIIILPMARFENLDVLISMFEIQRKHLNNSNNLEVNILINNDTVFDLRVPDWVKIIKCEYKGTKFWEKCNSCINYYIKNYLIEDTFYCFLNDDDFYPESLFNLLSKEILTDVNIISMKRGYNVTGEGDKAHPIWDLLAHPKNMKPTCVGIEQIIIKGNILKNYFIENHVWGDGMFIEKIVNENLINTSFFPNFYVYFNFLEKGRWDKKI